jgi:hypothetical protein
MPSDNTAAKNIQPGRVSVDLGELRVQVEDVCRRRGIQLSDFVRDSVNLHLEAELKREPQWKERALLYVLQAIDNLLRRTPETVLPSVTNLLRPLQKAEDELASRVYGRLSGIGHGGSLALTSRYPDARLFPWEWPALEMLIETIDGEDPLYLPMTGANKGTRQRSREKRETASPETPEGGARRPRTPKKG